MGLSSDALTAVPIERTLALFSGERAAWPGKRRMPMRRRESFVLAALVSALGVVLLLPGSAIAVDTAPVPIPGGFVPFPGAPFIHVFAPGPVDLGLMGENVEPNTITNFQGFSALAYLIGTATDADGNSYTMATDMRVFSGTYVSADGSVLHGTFAFI
jgi:hypothetical protein